MKNLPLGVNTLEKLLRDDCVYVDKTMMAHQLINKAGAYFLFRPRRFGKSLFVDTLKSLFEGNQGVFEGLYIHDHWDWSRHFPVIKLDFADGVIGNRQEFDRRIQSVPKQNSQRLGVPVAINEDIPDQFSGLILEVVEKYGQRAVVLVDEYDKPILDSIDKPGVAADIREGMKNLYSVLKEQDANL